jgi:hypothetical protein
MRTVTATNVILGTPSDFDAQGLERKPDFRSNSAVQRVDATECSALTRRIERRVLTEPARNSGREKRFDGVKNREARKTL